MKITKSQLKQIIKEEVASVKEVDMSRKHFGSDYFDTRKSFSLDVLEEATMEWLEQYLGGYRKGTLERLRSELEQNEYNVHEQLKAHLDRLIEEYKEDQ